MGEPAERRFLFFFLRINFDRAFENLLRTLLARGHTLKIALDKQKAGLPDHATYLFEALAAEYPTFSYEMVPGGDDPWKGWARSLRVGTDYLRYLEPAYADATALRARVEARAPKWVRAIARIGGRPGRAVLDRIMRVLERAIPAPDWIRDYISAFDPDVVVVTPLVGVGTTQGEYVRTARAMRIPTVLPVASWDNLTNKGVIRDRPDLTIVWNPRQIEEATELQGLARETVVATGAHSWDHWFSWEPSTSFTEFAERRGFDAGRPIILYVCSSNFIASDEVDFVREWLERLRASDDPDVREAGVIVRPHPQNTVMWADADLGDPRAVVWPREGAAPTNTERKNDYYDSLHHASAVMGINTSAQVEAAIVSTPVLTLLLDRFRETQEATLHFAHLQDLLIVGRSWDEHLEQVSAALNGRGAAHAGRSELFVEQFIRPNGRDAAAAPAAADLIEEAVAMPVASPRSGLLAPVMRLLTPLARRRQKGAAARAKARRRKPVKAGRKPAGR